MNLEMVKTSNSLFAGSADRPTIRDVALEAGVSIKTVSRVVNGEPNVRSSTASRVAEAISRLGYQPNELARSLKVRRSHTVALMIADISNPFYSVCAKAVEEVARERGYMVILCASDEDVEVELMYVDMLTRRRVEGLLLVPAANGRSHPGRERLGGLPIVALDRPIEDVPTDTVLVQNRSGAREGIKHLIDHGHQRIAFVGTDARVYTARERLEGYREALREAGLQEFCSIGATDIASAARSMKELLDLPEPPTAVFGVNNLITIGVLQALDQAGLRVPEDMALIGFDDFELASVLRPRLTVIRQPVPEIGRRAAELLFEQLKDGPPVNTRGVELATELVIRESCGCSEGVVVEEPPVTSLRHASP